ncbi:MAG: hypothetical protein EOP11_01075 [Proteobacteria bacterium]|nr:MAG: hypothetical protein EOP11_01075 [Pseudomonadota bacterium]
MKSIILAFALIFSVGAHAAEIVKGFNLTENESFPYDAAADGAPKLPAQIAVDEAKRLGANHIILNVRATMVGPYATELVPTTAPAERSNELKRMTRLVKYAKAQGLTVGIRPIFFVVGPAGEFPYATKQPDGSEKIWWHGNIQPSDPNRWFESFRVYLDSYITLAKFSKADEFTVGAELYSMTVGLEDQWKEYPYGFPGRWLELLRYVRGKLPNTRLMYDINFTDDTVSGNGTSSLGGELERWRYRIVDLADRNDPVEKQVWTDLTTFWKELDAVGIDMYRSLTSRNQEVPESEEALVALLRQRTDSFATQMDTAFTQISLTLDNERPVIFKELGYRSVVKGFVDPFAYAGQGIVSVPHQAAAFQAMFSSFWEAKWPWFGGFNFWEIHVDASKAGEKDNGFSPVGKPATEAVLKKYW